MEIISFSPEQFLIPVENEFTKMLLLNQLLYFEGESFVKNTFLENYENNNRAGVQSPHTRNQKALGTKHHPWYIQRLEKPKPRKLV